MKKRKKTFLQLCTFQRNTLLHAFNSLFSRTTLVNRYQKGKTSLDINEARDDDGVLGRNGISWTTRKQSAPRSRGGGQFFCRGQAPLASPLAPGWPAGN